MGRGYRRPGVGAFHARVVAALAVGWGWYQEGRENVPSGVQLPRDPPTGEQVLLNLDVAGPADGGVDANVYVNVGDGEASR